MPFWMELKSEPVSDETLYFFEFVFLQTGTAK